MGRARVDSDLDRADASRGGVEVQERAEQIGSWRTRALVVEGRGPVHVLLHGYADSADTWRQVLARLATQGRAGVAVDMPGFARAAPLADDEPVLSQLEAFARAAVRRFAERRRKVVLVGNSLGGSAALLAGADADRGLAGVVAVAPAGFDMQRWIYRLENFSLLQLALRLPPWLPDRLIQGVVGRIYRQLAIYDQGAVRDELVSTFSSHFAGRPTVTRYLAVARRLSEELNEPFELNDVRVPVLVVWGRQDRMLWHRNAELVKAAIPAARLETIERCGHCPQVERPDRATELILSVNGSR